jgi:hypothetical protein
METVVSGGLFIVVLGLLSSKLASGCLPQHLLLVVAVWNVALTPLVVVFMSDSGNMAPGKGSYT